MKGGRAIYILLNIEKQYVAQAIMMKIYNPNSEKDLLEISRNKYKKLCGSLLISFLVFVIIIISSWSLLNNIYTLNQNKNEPIARNVVQVAVEEAYEKNRVYPVDIDRNIDINFLRDEGFLKINVEMMINENKTFHLNEKNKVIIKNRRATNGK